MESRINGSENRMTVCYVEMLQHINNILMLEKGYRMLGVVPDNLYAQQKASRFQVAQFKLFSQLLYTSINCRLGFRSKGEIIHMDWNNNPNTISGIDVDFMI